MATEDIADAARLTWRFTQDFDGEMFQWGVSTGRREADHWSDFLDRMDENFTDALNGLVQKVHLVQLVYSEWGTSGFVGFHQKAEKLVNHSTGSSSVLPPQVAVACSLLNDTDLDISLKRRRGRFYLGLIAQGALDTNGRLTTTYHDGLMTALGTIQDALKDTVTSSSISGVDGMCIASAAEGKLIPVTKVGVGISTDTQRRRRQKSPESIVYADPNSL